MTTVVTANVLGKAACAPVVLPGRRRRLSTVVARHRPLGGRRYIVSVHRATDEIFQASDRTVKCRDQWSKTLVGPRDVVLITVVPMGKGFASIGLAIASIALIALAPYAAPLIAGSALGLGGAAVGTLSTAIQAGLVIGGVALAYAAQKSKASPDGKNKELYSVSGGGNLPRPGTRRPLLYGRCWTTPPLSQQDYFAVDGDSLVLTKRLTLGIGKFQVEAIRVGESSFWTAAGGVDASFQATGTTMPSQVEILYEQPSALMPGDVIASPSVAGIELPRPGGNPSRTPWYRLVPQGVVADAAQFNWTYPAIYRISSSGRSAGVAAGVVFYGREVDPDTGSVIGAEFVLWRSDEPSDAYIRTPLRRNAYFRLPKRGAYEVSAANVHPAPAAGVEIENRVIWDAMYGLKDDSRVRTNTTEIVIRVRAGKGLPTTAFSDVGVLATRIVPVWNGSSWVEQATRKAVWGYCDLVRATYGLALSSQVDASKALYYANLLPSNDTYDGALPEVSSFWEAAAEVLQPVRADPVKVGAVHSFVRDESRAEPRHVLTRRQIVLDSAVATYRTKTEGGDVIVEFDRDGDPKRPDEVRFSYGPATRTPKRYKVAGITSGLHALKHATWLAAVAVFRGVERRLTTEWDGRLVYPGDHILSDVWFLQGTQAYGVESRRDNYLLLDTDAVVPADWTYCSIRTRVGREWGILRVRATGNSPREVELQAEDVAALSSQTGVSLGSVLASEGQGPTTIVIGELTEVQRTFVARSAIPADQDHVQLQMVLDDARVWQLLDEAAITPAPINADSLGEPLRPTIDVLHARCVNIETGIEVVWGISTTRGARNFEADLSYDSGNTWEELSPFSPASSGRKTMRQSTLPVSVRARAYGRTNLPGDYRVTTFTTVAPVVDGRNASIVNLPPIDYEGLGEDVRKRIDHILEVEKTAVDALDKAVAGLRNSEANQAEIVAERQVRLEADSAMTVRIDGAISRIGDSEAAIVVEQRTRATADEAQASLLVGLRSDVNGNTASIVTESTTRADADSAISTRIDAVVATANGNTASIVREEKARADADSATATRIDGVSARVNDNTAAIATESKTRSDADSAQALQIQDLYAFSTNGTAFGRFIMEAQSGPAGVSARIAALVAVQRGGQTRGAGWYVDLRDDGASRFVIDADAFYITKNGSSVPGFSFDGQTLTIPSLVVTQSALLPGAASDRYSPVAPQNIDVSGTSDAWKEVPGTSVSINPDGKWSVNMSGTVVYSVTANGTNNSLETTRLDFAIGVNGVPYTGGNGFAGNQVTAGNGNNTTTFNSGAERSPAYMELYESGNTQRFSLLYRLSGGASGRGRINYAQLKLLVSKR